MMLASSLFSSTSICPAAQRCKPLAGGAAPTTSQHHSQRQQRKPLIATAAAATSAHTGGGNGSTPPPRWGVQSVVRARTVCLRSWCVHPHSMLLLLSHAAGPQQEEAVVVELRSQAQMLQQGTAWGAAWCVERPAAVDSSAKRQLLRVPCLSSCVQPHTPPCLQAAAAAAYMLLGLYQPWRWLSATAPMDTSVCTVSIIIPVSCVVVYSGCQTTPQAPKLAAKAGAQHSWSLRSLSEYEITSNLWCGSCSQVLNEAGSILDTLRQLRQLQPAAAELIVVDGGSTDG